MDWLNGLVRTKSGRKKPGQRTQRTRRVSRGSRQKRGSNQKRGSRTRKAAQPQTRYYIKGDGRIVTAYKRENGSGYVYLKRTPDGTRKVPINGTTYKTEAQAKKVVQAKREQRTRQGSGRRRRR